MVSCQESHAQDPLMAKANKMLTVSYGAANYNHLMLNGYLQEQSQDILTYNFTYSTKYSNPIAVTFDYAVSDYTAVGIGVNYYSFHLTENRKDIVDTFNLDTKGFRMAVQARCMRYFVQRPRSIFYFFAGAGIRFRSVKYNTTDQHDIKIAEIHQQYDASPLTYSPLSLEAGLGLKFLASKKIGLSSEFGMITGLAQFGLFYTFRNKWRKVNDNIGW